MHLRRGLLLVAVGLVGACADLRRNPITPVLDDAAVAVDRADASSPPDVFVPPDAALMTPDAALSPDAPVAAPDAAALVPDVAPPADLSPPPPDLPPPPPDLPPPPADLPPPPPDVPVCSNECSQGDLSCGPNGGPRDCVQLKGCWHWATSETKCATCSQCMGGKCAPRQAGEQTTSCAGQCQACDGTGQCKTSFQITCYRDLDGDGWGDPNSPNKTCSSVTTCPAGYVADHTDCFDMDPNAHPQGDATHKVGFHDAPRADGSWDWDCNGFNEKENPVTYTSCAFDCSDLPVGGIPAGECGMMYTSRTCAQPPPRLVCMPYQTQQLQKCR